MTKSQFQLMRLRPLGCIFLLPIGTQLITYAIYHTVTPSWHDIISMFSFKFSVQREVQVDLSFVKVHKIIWCALFLAHWRYSLLQAAVKVMAKDLIRTRHQITKFYALKSQLQGVSLRIQVCQWLCYLQNEKWHIHYFD